MGPALLTGLVGANSRSSPGPTVSHPCRTPGQALLSPTWGTIPVPQKGDTDAYRGAAADDLRRADRRANACRGTGVASGGASADPYARSGTPPMSRAQSQAGRTPDGITPLVGYRCWTLSIGPGHRALHSLNGQIVRQVDLDDPLGQRANPWLVARCLKKDHDAPEEGCSCGFYAVKSLSALGRLLPFATPRALLYTGGTEPGAAAFPVAGRVDLAGKVIQHDLGYRAERMRITELRAIAGTKQTVTRFARRIGVPMGDSIHDPRASVVPGGRPTISTTFRRSWTTRSTTSCSMRMTTWTRWSVHATSPGKSSTIVRTPCRRCGPRTTPRSSWICTSRSPEAGSGGTKNGLRQRREA
jgi:hypothetical protein